MNIKNYNVLRNKDLVTRSISTCHGFLRSGYSEIEININLTNYTKEDVNYFLYLSRIYKTVPDLKMKLVITDKEIEIVLLFKENLNNQYAKIIKYGCFCAIRFALIHSWFTKKWCELCKKYPKKSKFKLILFLNNLHSKDEGYSTERIYYHSFFTPYNPMKIVNYEMITFKEFIAKIIKTSSLNALFKEIGGPYKSYNDKKKELWKLI